MCFTILVLIPGDTPDEGIAPTLDARATPALGDDWGPGWRRTPVPPPMPRPERRLGQVTMLLVDEYCEVRLLRDRYARGTLQYRPMAVITLAGVVHREEAVGATRWPATVDALLAAAPGALAIFIENYC